ncbi:MAG: BatD family protein [Candidatus Chromulinivorax sp.]
MEKKAGSFILLFSFLVIHTITFAFDNGSIVLRIQDMNHKAIEQAMITVPFILQVELKNLEGYSDNQLLESMNGIENFKTSQSMVSHNISIDNGKRVSKVIHNFILQADAKGKFTLGPITLKNKSGQSLTSNRLVVIVGDEVVNKEKNNKEQYFLQISVDKKRAYIGEKIRLKISFYDRILVENLQIQFPQMKNIEIIQYPEEVKRFTQIVENQEYNVTEWIVDIYPKETGPLILQNIQAAFYADQAQTNFGFGAFDFFRSLYKTEQHVIAQPVKVDVISLPYNEQYKNVQAVGQFTDYKIMVNQDSFAVGQGIVLTAQLYGQGNFEMINSLKLELPKELHYYDSQMVSINDRRDCKVSDFVIQAEQEGQFIIKPQKFIYFDPQDAQYKLLESNSVAVTITKALQTDSLPKSLLDQLEQEDKNFDAHTEKTLQDFFIVQSAIMQSNKDTYIPFEWYQWLLMAIFCIWIFIYGYRSGFYHYFTAIPYLKKQFVFYRAYRQFKKAYRQKNILLLHTMFTQLFSHLMQVSCGKVQKDMIVQYLADKHFSDDQIKAWQELYDQIALHLFSQEQNAINEALFLSAQQWLTYLKERV